MANLAATTKSKYCLPIILIPLEMRHCPVMLFAVVYSSTSNTSRAAQMGNDSHTNQQDRLSMHNTRVVTVVEERSPRASPVLYSYFQNKCLRSQLRAARPQSPVPSTQVRQLALLELEVPCAMPMCPARHNEMPECSEIS